MLCLWLSGIVTMVMAVQLNHDTAVLLTRMLQACRVLKDVPATADDVDLYYAAKLAEGTPECPTRTPFWSCNVQGEIDEVTVRGDGSPAPVDFQLLSNGIYFRNTSWILTDVTGTFQDFVFFLYPPHLVGNNLVLLAKRGLSFTTFPFKARNLTLTNVTATEVVFDDENFQFDHCAFTNVTLRCPIPRFLLPCFNQSTLFVSAPMQRRWQCCRRIFALSDSRHAMSFVRTLRRLGTIVSMTQRFVHGASSLEHQGSRPRSSLSQDAFTRARSVLRVSCLGLSIEWKPLTGNCVRGRPFSTAFLNERDSRVRPTLRRSIFALF
jgi:hypothetical protein